MSMLTCGQHVKGQAASRMSQLRKSSQADRRVRPYQANFATCDQNTNFTPSCSSRIGFLVLLMVP
jgi:hypothetical protein